MKGGEGGGGEEKESGSQERGEKRGKITNNRPLLTNGRDEKYQIELEGIPITKFAFPKIFSMNINGIKTTENRDTKIPAIKEIIQQEGVDIICLQEAHTREEDLMHIAKWFPAYLTLMKPTSKNGTGGNVILIKIRYLNKFQELKIQGMKNLNATFGITLNHCIKPLSINVINVYQEKQLSNMEEELRYILQSHKNKLKPTILIGDFNAISAKEDTTGNIHRGRKTEIGIMKRWKAEFALTEVKTNGFTFDERGSKNKIDKVFVNQVGLNKNQIWKAETRQAPEITKEWWNQEKKKKVKKRKKMSDHHAILFGKSTNMKKPNLKMQRIDPNALNGKFIEKFRTEWLGREKERLEPLEELEQMKKELVKF